MSCLMQSPAYPFLLAHRKASHRSLLADCAEALRGLHVTKQVKGPSPLPEIEQVPKYPAKAFRTLLVLLLINVPSISTTAMALKDVL